MKRFPIVTALGLAAVLLTVSGCAGVGPDAERGPVSKRDAYMASVERNARLRGLDVVWINPPAREREPAEDGTDKD